MPPWSWLAVQVIQLAWTQRLHGPQMPTRLQGACQIPGILRALNGNKNLGHHHRPGCDWATDPGMAPATAHSRWCHGLGWQCHSGLYGLSSSTALEYQLCHRWQPRYWSFMYPFVATWVMDINTDPGYSRDRCSRHGPWLQSRAHVITALVCLIGHTGWHGPQTFLYKGW